MPRSEIGQVIRAARIRAGYATIYAFWKATGISRGQMRDLEAGVCSPSIATLKRIGEALECDLIVEFRLRKPRERRLKP